MLVKMYTSLRGGKFINHRNRKGKAATARLRQQKKARGLLLRKLKEK